MRIYCVACKEEVTAELIDGSVAYPHRHDLSNLKFWRCKTCNNFVGTHKDTMLPLGVIATPELKAIRVEIHSVLDSIWRNKFYKRKTVYKKLSKKLGYEYHTAEIRSVKEAKDIYYKVLEIAKEANERKLAGNAKKRAKLITHNFKEL